MSRLETVGRDAGVFFTAAELATADFPEPRWAVPGVLAEGVNLLAGSPKLGKSWLALGLAIAVASGGRALGRIPVDRGDVLYAALEDTPRRLQNRLAVLLADDGPPHGLDFVVTLPRLPDAADLITEWLNEHPTARLVIIDVLRKVRPRADERTDLYGRDYDAMSQLKAIADRYAVAVLVVHHVRKSDAEDVFDTVSGSNGLTGGADAILVAKRLRNSATAELHVTGRDVEERSYALEWSSDTCTWTLLDEPVAVVQMSDTRRGIVTWLEANTAGTPAQIAAGLQLDITANTLRQTLRRMAEAGQVDSDGQGTYFLPLPLSPVTPVTQSLVSDNGDRSDMSREMTS